MGEAGGARGVWGYVQGGMGGLADALERLATICDVEIRRNAPVQSILTSQGRVTGVGLQDGGIIEADVVASSVDAHLTFECFLKRTTCPPNSARPSPPSTTRRRRPRSTWRLVRAAAVHLCCRARGIAPHHHGTMHIWPTLDYIDRAYDDAKYGRPSRAHSGNHDAQQRRHDNRSAGPTRDVDVRAVRSLQAGQRQLGRQKEAFGDRCIERASAIRSQRAAAIVHRQVSSPLDLERTFGLTGGNIMQGAMNFNQLFCFRPVAGWADHRTPVKGLYLCGAASHPGGGVMVAPGMNAASAILGE